VVDTFTVDESLSMPMQLPDVGKCSLGLGLAAPVENSIASPPHMPREDGLAHPADTSRSNLAAACVCFRTLSVAGLSGELRPPHRATPGVPQCMRCGPSASPP
jgi:hypothetical protein